MSSGARRDRDDRPRDWREAHLSTSSSYSSKRKGGPDEREYDSRGSPRPRGDYRRNDKERGYSGSYRRDSYHERERASHSSRRDILDYGEGKTNGDRKRSKSRTPPRSTSAARSQKDDDLEEGEISSPPPARNAPEETAKDEPPAEPLPDMELVLPESPPPVEDLLAARRAKRAAILAKYQSSITDAASAASPMEGVVDSQQVSSEGVTTRAQSTAPPSGVASVVIPTESRSRDGDSDGQATPPETNGASEAFDLAKGNDEQTSSTMPPASTAGSSLSSVAANPSVIVLDPAEQISAADYDPNADRREDEARHAKRAAAALADGTGELPNQPEVIMADATTAVDEEEEIEVTDDDGDDLDDMFAIEVDKPKKKKKIIKKKQAAKPVVPRAIALTTVDTAADSEGYYQIVLGEALDGGRYQVFSSLGRGMFSAVVRARIIDGEGVGNEVAIKIIRAQESMFKAGLKEVQILNKLAQADPDDKKHLIRLERTFEHRGHLCLVFESLSMNLREVVKRFGKDVGLNISAVRAYAYQLLLALSLLKKCNIMHADIKPDNILVNDSKNNLKLCDLGSASDVSEGEIAPYLVSRFYRAPEIILGLPYDCAIDMWSIGCTLYELYTGKILLPGRTNNQMLLHMMELKGRFNAKLIKKAPFGSAHFDEGGLFTSIEVDGVTGKDTVRQISITKPKRDMRARIIPSPAKLKEPELKVLTSFVDLLDKCLTLDATKRISPKEALSHPFIRG